MLLGCPHPSRQNTNTGKLTPLMRAVFARARALSRKTDMNRRQDPPYPPLADDPRPGRTSPRLPRSRALAHRAGRRVELPNGTIIPEYWISEYPPWVNVVAVTADERVVLIRQYRHGLGEVHFELPAGTTDPGDPSLETAARRELHEETGYSGGSWSLLMTVSANPALNNNLTTRTSRRA